MLQANLPKLKLIYLVCGIHSRVEFKVYSIVVTQSMFSAEERLDNERQSSFCAVRKTDQCFKSGIISNKRGQTWIHLYAVVVLFAPKTLPVKDRTC